jgi:epoxide hydrolase-like predicted phosphatase
MITPSKEKKTSKSSVKHIILDVGGVIFVYGKKPLLGRMPPKYRPYTTAVDLGKITFTEFINIYNKKEGTQYSIKTFFEEAYKNRRYNKELIAFCKKTSCKLSILSNNSRANIRYFRKNYDLSWASPQVYSCNRGIKKPNSAIYVYMLKRLKAKPADCIFIDDKERNTKVAKAIGMHVIIFKNTKQTIQEVKHILGITSSQAAR